MICVKNNDSYINLKRWIEKAIMSKLDIALIFAFYDIVFWNIIQYWYEENVALKKNRDRP